MSTVAAKVSINIPTYNRAHLLRHALDSVLRQTYPNIEIIVIDDGSSDTTRAIVAEYGDRVQYFYQPNGGLGAARNAGLERSTGAYVAFLDSDDEWLEFKLGLQVAAFDRLHEVSFMFSEFAILKDNGALIRNGSRTWLSGPPDWSSLYSRQHSSAELGIEAPGVHAFQVYTGRLYRLFLSEALILPTTAIVRRDAIGDVRFTEGMRVFEDWEFFARLARSHTAAFLDVETAINRGHSGPERMTRANGAVKAQRYLKMLERVWLADEPFQKEHGLEFQNRHSNAVLAVAREALLNAQPALAKEMLRQHRTLAGSAGRPRALAYAFLSNVPGGRGILKSAVLSRKILRSATTRHGTYPVNPAA